MRKGPVLILAAIVALVWLSNYTKQQTSELPDLRHLTFHNVQTRAQAAGFNRITTQDALHRDRTPWIATTGTVCFQQPALGQYSITTQISLAVVKTDDTCP
ncbi:hypothetical protein ACFU8W_23265 [Streptomyces sp. NPDC057565]|uniref:hypothetical protein n=1 Tax=Streptomyces sp. NPDC057565 TaxID=3346169 RepID=UPI0036C950EF